MSTEQNDSIINDNSVSISTTSSSSIIETAFTNISPIFCNYSPILKQKYKPFNNNSSSSYYTSNTSQIKFHSAKYEIINNSVFPNQVNKNKSKQNNIIIENIIRGIDKRTTLMIKNIPNKYSLKSLTEEINHKFKNKYDIFYLPIDYSNNISNLGFAFINFVNPLHIVDFYETFNRKKWKRFFSEKICELAYAKIQGKQNLINHFEKGIIMNSQTKDKKPLILNIIEPLPKITLNIKHKQLFQQIYPHQKFNHSKSKKYITINNFY